MRFLGVGEHCDLGDMYLRLQQAGHEVRVFVRDPGSHDILRGLITRCDDWQAELDWVRAAGSDGVVVFEDAKHGAVQDELRGSGLYVVGGCTWGDRLESDRGYAQEVLAGLGLPIARTDRFRSFEDAIASLQAQPRRTVFKLNGADFAPFRNHVGDLDDGRDMRALLEMQRRRWAWSEAPDFVLMEHKDGVEMGVGAYFDGHKFLTPAVLDWEHKRFFPRDRGELTGEMGTLITYRGSEKFFALTLGKLAPLLEANGYVGYINLNTVVNDDGIWPLELTSRFGYPGFAICDELHVDGWAPILKAMATGDGGAFRTHPGFAVGVVLTVPPFPYGFGYDRLSQGAPILFRDGFTDDDRGHLHFGEVSTEPIDPGVDGDPAVPRLVCGGSIGYVMVVTGRGDDVAAAQRAALDVAGKVVIPNVRYRDDIGDRFVARDHAILRRLGLLD